MGPLSGFLPASLITVQVRQPDSHSRKIHLNRGSHLTLPVQPIPTGSGRAVFYGPARATRLLRALLVLTNLEVNR